MSSSARLKYKIVKCTSEDPEFPVSELLAHSSQTKGWQTARFCEFPQEIGLQFETPVHLRQVQFLSHQSKIATKIELFAALPTDGQNCRYDVVQFKRLGYLSLDNNERSQFQARELKSVYVDVSAQFLKLVFHKCHVNRYNIVNQVALIALHCSGEVLGPDLAVGPPPPNPMLARNPSDNAHGQRAGGHTSSANAAEQAQDAAQAAADEMRYDSRTLERIRALTLAKQRAVEAEDYEEAKRCKEMLTRLRQAGQLLRELEDRKKVAVQNEDYDAAKALKSEIDRLRTNIDERPQNLGDGREKGNSRAPFDQPSGNDGRRSPDWAPQSQTTAPRGAHQPQGALSGNGYELGGPLGQPSHSQGRLASASPDSPLVSPHGGDPMFGADGGGPQGGGRSGSMPTMNSYYDENPAFDPPMGFEGSGNIGGGPSRVGAQSPPLHGAQSPPLMPGGATDGAPPQGQEREGATPSEAAHHLRGVPNVEDILTSPEVLPPALEKDKEVELLLQLFGDYITRCIFSKTWNLRDAALQKLALDLREGARNGDDPSQLLQAYANILKRTIADKNVQVNLSSGALVQAVSQMLLENGSNRRQDVQAILDPLMPLLVERLGEPNARVDKTARDCLLELGRCRSVGAHFTAQFLLKPPKKKTGGTVHARVYTSRLQVLTSLASEFGVQPESRDGVPLESTVQLAMEAFNHKDGDVRENSVKLVGACYMHVGPRRIEGYLASLRPAQREVFEVEFDRVSGGGGRTQVPARGRQDEDDLPPASIPPPRGGSSSASASGRQQEEASFDEQEPPEFTCQFCGRQDPAFTPEALDVHYWRDCPMLTQCQFCQQVIEISTLRTHLIEECEAGQPAKQAGESLSPNQCPLCRADVGNAEDQDWMRHLLTEGCPANPRDGTKK